MGRDELLRREAPRLTRTVNTRTENERGLPCGDRRHQNRNEFGGITAVAIEKHQNVCIIAHGGNACLDGATITKTRLDNHSRSGGLCPLHCTIPRASVDDDHFVHILRQHRGDDPTNRRFLIEAWNDRGDDRCTARCSSLVGARVCHVGHRLQRRPQLAQALGGLSESNAARNS